MTKTMKAIGFKKHLPIEANDSLQLFELPITNPSGHDLLVKISAISVNPVDVLVRNSGHDLKNPKIIGWDAVGTVEMVGDKVTLFKPGDKVFYAGDFKRSGSDSQYQLVDERIVGVAPKTLSDAQIAAMPLTSLTAFEALFEKLEISPDDPDNKKNTILIINGAGGVGSVATQLARWANLNIIATASRSESIDWVKKNGAQLIVNHHKNLVTEVHKLGYEYVDYILELNNLDMHWDEMSELIKPDGKIASITENHRPIDLKKITKKRATFSWEWMYSKSYYQTPNMISQHYILNQIGELLDKKIIHSTLAKELTPITVDNLKKAHELVESNHMIGKVVLSDFSKI